MRKTCLVIMTMIAGLAGLAELATERTLANGSRRQDDLARVKRISLDILRDRTAGRGVGLIDEFQLIRVYVDELNSAHTRVRQTVGGVPVWGGEAIVHLRPDGSLFAVTDDLKANVLVNPRPNFQANEAITIAKGMYDGSAFLTAEPLADLWVYRGDKRDHLAYRVQMRREDGSNETAMPVIFIDAQTGEKIFEYDNLQTGTGPSLYSGALTFNTSFYSRQYYMEDLTRMIGTFTMNNGTTTAARFNDANDVWNANHHRAGIDAHYAAAKTFDYYQIAHGRSGLDGAGGPRSMTSAANGQPLFTSRVHYSSNYNNAFWNGTVVTYGDGNGTLFGPLVALDICGHEMTHGVTDSTAGLIYSGESGALNESFSDVFGAMIERYAKGESATTWKIGEQAYTPANGTGDALRDMGNPHAASNGGYTADDDPDHYAERYTGQSDNGGVHVNSGIGNKAFYLLAVGGVHHRSGISVTGIGADDAARIWYRALTTYLTSESNFNGARAGTLYSALDLFGETSPQYAAVERAWCAVGIGSCDFPQVIVNGGFESTLLPWVAVGTGVTHQFFGSYPHSGTGYVTMGGRNNAAQSLYQEITIPADAAGRATFWLNVTSAENAYDPWDKLFVEVRSSTGALLRTLGTFSNVNQGTAGVYVQRGTFDLSEHRGQTVRLQFRVSADNSLITTFRIDDVEMY